MRPSIWPICLFAFAAALSAQTPAPAAAVAPTYQSPEILPDHSVTFRLYAPAAAKVLLAGDWIERNQPPIALIKDDRGLWSATVGPLTPDVYSYSFNVDGVRVLDPKNFWLKPGINLPDTQFEVPGEAIAFADLRDVPHGEVRALWYHSTAAGIERRMRIYTPPGYNTSRAAYPVLYLLHGGGDDDAGWTDVGRINFILDNLIAQGKAKPMMVVMPDGFVRDPSGALPPMADRLIPGKSGPPLEHDLLENILPLVEKNYRVAPGAANRALAGLAVGGAQTLWIGMLHWQQFGYLADFSSGLDTARDPEFEKRNAEFLTHPGKVNAAVKKFTIVYGSTDTNPVAVKNLSAVLTRYGIHHQLRESPGGHTWMNWRHWIADFLPELFTTPNH